MILDTFRDGKYSSMQWLAIAPLLALSTSLVNGIVAGFMMFFLLIILSIVFSTVRRLIPFQLRLPVVILIISTVISMMDMGMQFFFYELRESFGIYLPLLGVNSLIFAMIEDCFFRDGFKESLRQALLTGLVFLILFMMLGMIREAAGYGALFRNAEMISGSTGLIPMLRLPGVFTGITLIHTAPGALLACGLMAAMIRYIFKNYRPDSTASTL